jgi:hypothetical protein
MRLVSRSGRSAIAAGLVIVALLVAGAAPVAADQSNHTEYLVVTRTAAGAAAGHPALRSGHVVNIHAQGPQVFAIEGYELNGARPMTDYAVVLELYAGTCSGGLAFLFPNGAVLSTDAAGNAHGQARIVPEQVAELGLHDTDWGIVWDFVDPDGSTAYQTACTQVHID